MKKTKTARKKKARMGRPPKAPEDRRSAVLFVKLTTAEKELIDEAAGEMGCSVWARDVVLRAARRRV